MPFDILNAFKLGSNQCTEMVTFFHIRSLNQISRLNLIKCLLVKIKKDDSEEYMHCKHLRPDKKHVKYLIVQVTS